MESNGIVSSKMVEFGRDDISSMKSKVSTLIVQLEHKFKKSKKRENILGLQIGVGLLKQI